jgi:KTSC domain
MTIELEPVKSGNIARIGYDPAKKELHVQFHPRPGMKTGPVWKYAGVEPHEYDQLKTSRSVGSQFANFIKPYKAATKVSDGEAKDLITEGTKQNEV